MNRLFISVLLACVVVHVCSAEEATVSAVNSAEDDEVDQCMRKALEYLLSQQKGDGAIFDARNQTAMTALAIMAIYSAGHMPADDTKEGKALVKALEFVLHEDRCEKNGYFGNRDGSRMYGHGIVTLMLAEALGMGVDEDQDRRIRERLEKAVQLILWSEDRQKGRNHYGGWRYHPNGKDSDLSVTIWQLLALRAAKNAGLEVPKKSIDKAIEYLKRCYKSKRDKSGNPTDMKSACGYQPGGRPGYASAAAGLLALQVCGEYDVPEVKGSANWLRGRKLNYGEKFFFYGTYYYAQGMYQCGGEFADHAKRNVESILLEKQREDGSWKSRAEHESSAGKVYATSMAVLSLSVHYHYLPIYQR